MSLDNNTHISQLTKDSILVASEDEKSLIKVTTNGDVVRADVSVLLCGILLTTAFNFSFAVDKVSLDNNTHISQLTKDSILVTSEDEKSLIKVTTNGDVVRTDVYDLLTNNNYYFITNKKNNTIYSSATGKYIKIDEFETVNTSKMALNSLSRSASDGKYIKTVKISTRTLSNIMLGVSAAALVAALVAAGAGPIVISKSEYAFKSLSSAAIAGLLNNNDYLAWDVYEVETSSIKGGKRYYYKMEKIENLRFE